MLRGEFDLLELSELLSVLEALKARDDSQAARDAQLFAHVCNAPHFLRKGEKPYSPYDFLPESQEDRAAREQEKLSRSLSALKALSANKTKAGDKGSVLKSENQKSHS